ncbi:unnamed protein product [Darwinula stevensoni]|uniref:GST N-terminal domain-containing protein n=1 Tax=Darwinula stevensoni TaxID=69355 RepID=A0A7R9FTT0_9CRUS|nr:unnamed protein product [Darwinula stevensoni]CAG0905461.1 unnamed protein product [Darwinula stevensoni]
MPIDLYYVLPSPPCRSVMLLAKDLGVELNLKPTSPMSGATRTPEFLKMNPQHTIPTMNDGGFCLWESRAILRYLNKKYSKTDKLYPKDAKGSGLVDQRLDFDISTFSPAYLDSVVRQYQLLKKKNNLSKLLKHRITSTGAINAK